MRMLKAPKITEKGLMFRDYVSFHVQGSKPIQTDISRQAGQQVSREELFQQIETQRGEVVELVEQRAKKPSGDLIDVRLRRAGATRKGWLNLSEVMDEDDKFVA